MIVTVVPLKHMKRLTVTWVVLGTRLQAAGSVTMSHKLTSDKQHV